MSNKYATLEAACGGVLNPDTLRTFAKAMKEYEVFMAGLEVMFAPKDMDPHVFAARKAHYERLLETLGD